MPVYTYITIDDPSANAGTTEVWGINAAGQIVGQYTDASNHVHGFLYSNGTYTTLDDPVATGTIALGINNMGQIVGQYFDASNHGHGFLYSNGAYTTLDDPAGFDTLAQSINDTGQIVGSYNSASGYHGFLFDPSGGIFPLTSP
jgi:probable HAF family extracellular repeat protein